MGDDSTRPGQYSLKWALLQTTLCAMALAALLNARPETGLYTFCVAVIALFSALGAIVGGFVHRFARGAVIGCVVGLPGFYVAASCCVYFSYG